MGRNSLARLLPRTHPKRVSSIALTLVIPCIAVALAILTALTVLPTPAQADSNPYTPTVTVTTADGITFGRATAAYKSGTTSYEGMPLFDGTESHLNSYISLLMQEIGSAGWVRLAAGSSATGSYTDSGGTHVYNIPAGSGSGGEALEGASGQTALSSVMYQAQSWDKDLINQIGNVEARENKSKRVNGGYNYATGNTSMMDMRQIPLSGRYSEGYGEDPVLASIFVDLNSKGFNGYGKDETGLYILGAVNSKHYPAYGSEFFRSAGLNEVSARSFYEFNSKSADTALQNGTISSFMTQYGSINNVPGTATFALNWAMSRAKYPVSSGPDAGATTPYLAEPNNGTNMYGQFGNGFDQWYSPNKFYMAASLLAANHGRVNLADAQVAIAEGLNGVTNQSASALAKAYLIMRTRVGLYDVRDADGLSLYYPFNNIGAAGSTGSNVTTYDYKSTADQDVALANAREGIVLLKNSNSTLPVSSSSKLGVYGVFAKAVNDGIYNVVMTDTSLPSRGSLAGANALEALQAKTTGSVHFDMGLNTVTIQTKGGYLYVDGANADPIVAATVQVKTADEFSSAADKTGYYFAILDQGQDAYSIYSYGAQKWLRVPVAEPIANLSPGKTAWTVLLGCDTMSGLPNWPAAGKPFVVADYAANFKETGNMGLPPMLSNFPYMFTMEDAGASGSYYVRAGSLLNNVTFTALVPSTMTKHDGWYLESQNGQIGLGGNPAVGADGSKGAGLAYFNGLSDKSSVTFTINEVAAPGSAASTATAPDDCAVIFVGQNAFGLSGEGIDRVNLALGQRQIDEALNIAKAYKDAGKKTVVVVYSVYPVIVDALKESPNVDAIVFAGYGGQFGGRATAEVLYGDYAPTGRLVSTWYSDMDLFPKLDKYSIPPGNDNLPYTWDISDTTLGLDDLDNNVTVDMSSADVVGTGLTYQYLTNQEVSEHVAYPFGYGLSYANFEYSSLQAPDYVEGTRIFDVSVDVTNNSGVTSADVVELYMSNSKSEYGSYAPVKKLAAFERVEIPAGTTKTVTLSVDPNNFALWDVNAGKYVVEDGQYVLYAAHSSDLTASNTLSKDINVKGSALSPLNAGACNVWSHSFASYNVHFDEYSKLTTAAAAASANASGTVNDGIFAVTAKGPGAWVAIPKVSLTLAKSVTLNVGAPSGVSNPYIELRADSPTGRLLGTVEFAATGSVTKDLVANADAPHKAQINELGYVNASVNLKNMGGVRSLYLVFGGQDIRVGTIQIVY